MEFDFPKKKYVGISKLISHVSHECQELILWMLTYNPDNRPTASQTIKHNYFKDLRDVDTQRYVAPQGNVLTLSRQGLPGQGQHVALLAQEQRQRV